MPGRTTKGTTMSQDFVPVGLNLAVITGRLSSEPVERTLPSGDLLTTYEVTVPRDDAASDTVPVALVAARGPRGLKAGDHVFVIGRVRRRFFRAGGSTASRTEVVADQVLPVRRAKAVSIGLDRARHLIDELAG